MRNRLYWTVDTDISSSASMTDHPVSSRCRKFLISLKKTDRIILMSPEMRAEWKNHRSNFSKTWLSNMIARKKVIFLSTEDLEDINFDWENLEEQEQETAKKDFHLISAALTKGKNIASRDDNSRVLYLKVANSNPRLRSLMWVNPVTMSPKICDALCGNLNAEAEWKLGE